MRAALALALLPTSLAAETPMTGAEFQARVGTDTIAYLYSNGVRGVADYGPDRTLLWAFEGGECVKGYWFDDGSQLCFAFEDGTLSACWQFFLQDNRLRGKASQLGSGGLPDLEIYEVAHTDQPLTCAGPDLGA